MSTEKHCKGFLKSLPASPSSSSRPEIDPDGPNTFCMTWQDCTIHIKGWKIFFDCVRRSVYKLDDVKQDWNEQVPRRVFVIGVRRRSVGRHLFYYYDY